MTRSILIRLAVVLLVIPAGCRSDRTLTEQRRETPLASPGEIARFSLLAPDLAVLPADGQCDTIARGLDELSSVKGQLVSFGSSATGRRITVGVDATSRIVYYADTHTGHTAEWVVVDRRFDDGMALSMTSGSRPRRVHAHADDILHAPALGSPEQVARRVLQACSAMLTAGR